MSYIRIVTAASVEPISLADAKKNLRVDHSDDDAKITRHITEAREWVERRIQKAIANVEYQQAFDGFPSNGEPLELSILPVVSISNFLYEDLAGVTQTMVAATDYNFKAPFYLYPVATTWPQAIDRVDSVRVKYIAGYTGIELIPTPVIAAMYLKIQGLYDGDDVDGAIHSLLTNYYTMVA